MDLRGKHVLVTGAARRVGRAIALRLAEDGVRLLLHYRDSREDAEETAALAERRGARVSLHRASFDDSAGVLALADDARRSAGRVDVLVNNASIFARRPLEEIDEAHWDAMHMVNAKAPFLLCRAFGPEMKRRGAGKIVNLADVSAENPWAGYAAYCASKAALLSVTLSLAKALAPEVQVNAVAPGPVIFPEGASDAEKARALERTLLRREGSPEDVAETVRWLVAGTDFVTGALIPVDGGRRIA